MSRFFRSLVALLLAALVPLQGYAALAMVSCGPTHGQMADHHAEHVGHGHGGHAHEGTHGDASTLTSAIDATCSACASCCASVSAPAPARGMPELVAAVAEDIPFVEPRHDSIIPEGLERPPRAA